MAIINITIKPIHNWRKWPRMLSVHTHIALAAGIITWMCLLPTSTEVTKRNLWLLLVLVGISVIARFIAQPDLHKPEGDFLE